MQKSSETERREYPNKAVVELHPDEAGGNPAVPRNGLVDNSPHNLLGRRAGPPVEPDPEGRVSVRSSRRGIIEQEN